VHRSRFTAQGDFTAPLDDLQDAGVGALAFGQGLSGGEGQEEHLDVGIRVQGAALDIAAR